MEAAVLWKAAMRPRLPTGLGKRRHEPAGVSHSSHTPCSWEKRAQARGRGRGKNPALSHINNQSPGGGSYLANRGESWAAANRRTASLTCPRIFFLPPQTHLHVTPL